MCHPSIDLTWSTQVLCKVYSILTDKDKRAIYDEDGTVDEDDASIFKQVRLCLISQVRLMLRLLHFLRHLP